MFLGTVEAAIEKPGRTSTREAFFLEFARAIREKFRNVPLVVTGGFRSRLGMEAALEEDACDMIGVGRPAVLDPSLPKKVVFNEEVKDEDAKLYAKKIEAPWIVKKFGGKAVGAGVESVSDAGTPSLFYGLQLTRKLVVVWQADEVHGAFDGLGLASNRSQQS